MNELYLTDKGGYKDYIPQEKLNEMFQDLMGQPAWVCELSKVKRNMQIIEKVQNESGAKILVALKGFSHPGTFHVLRKTMKGCCASGLYEAKLAKEFGGEVHSYSPGFKENEIEEIISLSDHIVFNSISQYKKYSKMAKEKGVSVAIRVNPEHSSVKTKIYNPCVPYSRFGITRKVMLEALKEEPGLFDDLDGIHFHALCKQSEKDLEQVLEKVKSNFGELLEKVHFINVGGGHNMTDTKLYNIDYLIGMIKNFKDEYTNIQDFYMEPGEAIGFDCGPLVGEVVDIHYNEMPLAIIDLSASAHLVDVLEMPYRPQVQNAGVAGEKKYTYRIGGNTCLSGDVLGDFSFDYELKEGDKIVIHDQQHYSFVKSTFFNGVIHPHIIIVDEDGHFIKTKHFEYKDFRDRLGFETI